MQYIQGPSDAAGGEAKFRLTPENLKRWDVLGYNSLDDFKSKYFQLVSELPKASFHELNI